MRKTLISVLLLFSIYCLNIQAATITADSCEYNDVSIAVSSAQIGDTVLVPAGSATWQQTLVIRKGIILKSIEGAENTIINAGMGISQYMVRYEPLSPDDNPHFRLSGFTFDAGDAALSLKVLNLTISPITIRIDHNRFIDCTQEGLPNSNLAPFLFEGTIYGVVDNNIFSGDVHIDNMGLNKESWINSSFQYGTSENLYFEDNIFTSSFTLDSGGHGGRYCNRYNTYNMTKNVFPLFDAHGNQFAGVYTTMGVEFYGNLVKGESGDYSPNPFFGQRGGKALVFFNRIDTAQDRKSVV